MSITIYFVLFLMLVSSLGATLIGFPGNWIILLILIGFSFFTDFTVVSMTQTVILAGILLLGEAIESGLALINANRYKPSRWSLVGAFFGGIIGALIGTSILPIIGSILGAAAGVFLAAYLVELRITGNDRQAGQVAKAAMIGSLLGTTIKFMLAVGVVIYLFWLLILNSTPVPNVGVPF